MSGLKTSWFASKGGILVYWLVLMLCFPVCAYGETQETPLVSNFFIDTYISDALKDIAYQAGVNIIPDMSVHGFVTVEFYDVTLEEALRLILYPGGYMYRKVSDTYLVGSADPASPLFHKLAVSESVRLNYIKADEAKRLLADFYLKYARFDPTSNTVFITSSPDIVERFLADIALIDKPPAQVTIEVLVTELSSEARKALGLDLAGSFSSGHSGNVSGFDFKSGDGTLNLNIATGLLQAKIISLANEGMVQIRANPRLTVVDGSSAEIFIGKDRYYRLTTSSSSSFTSTRLESIDTGVGLKVAPKIAGDGNITLLVEPMVSDVSGMVMNEGLPIISRRQASTTVRVKDGETVSLGGLIQQIEQSGRTGAPIISDLPIFRNFFGSTYRNIEETEVVIFITPRIEHTL
ncbi:MAG TPA: hypothetical protein GXZ82_08230 [Firmicutes bacterium]|jgi:type II secretory pathway component GspD/PulD (secretin)|nr:hypothetical protein [Bacillota bacterium]